MRDVVVFAVVFGALPFAFVRPFYGLLLFAWLAYMRGPDLCWGPAKSFHFSMIVAAVMYTGWALFDKRRFMRKDARNFFMILMACAITCSYIGAPLKIEAVRSKFFEFIKVIAIALFTTGQLDSKRRIRAIIWVIALSFAFYGIKGGIWGLITRDARIIRGPGGLLLDNNDFSLAMVMNLPFLHYLAFTEESKRVKRFLRVAFGLTVITIALTGSRGGFLAMSAAVGAIVLKSRSRMLAIVSAVVAALLILPFIPHEYWERIGTISTAAHTDASAIGRLRAWYVAWQMIQRHPIFGVGFQNFLYEYDKYDPGLNESIPRVAHNSYFQIWAESGTFAYLFFMSSILSTILLMRRLQRQLRNRGGPEWIKYYASIIEVSLYGFLVGATFLNRAHFDFVYQLMAIGVALYPVSWAEMLASEKKEVRHGRVGQLVIRSKNPFVFGGAR